MNKNKRALSVMDYWRILEKQVPAVVKVVEDKIDDEIAALDQLDLDDIDVLKEHRLQQMKKKGPRSRAIGSPSDTVTTSISLLRRIASPSLRLVTKLSAISTVIIDLVRYKYFSTS